MKFLKDMGEILHKKWKEEKEEFSKEWEEGKGRV